MITVFIGENIIDRDDAVRAFEQSFISTHGDLSYFKVDADIVQKDELIDALLSVPLFSDKKLVKITGLEKNKEYIEIINNLSANIPDNCQIIIVVNAFDSRLKAAKDLLSKVTVRDYPLLDRSALEGWVENIFKQEQSSISGADIRYLIERVGEDQQKLYHEATKLALLKNIDRQTIDLMTDKSLTSTVFNLLDAISASDRKKAIKIFDEQISLGNEPLAILGMITWQLFNISLLYSGLKQMPRPELMKQSGMSPFVFRKTVSVAEKMNNKTLITFLDKTINAEYQIKNKPVDSRSVIKNLIVNLAV